jgi:hypothetical protein
MCISEADRTHRRSIQPQHRFGGLRFGQDKTPITGMIEGDVDEGEAIFDVCADRVDDAVHGEAVGQEGSTDPGSFESKLAVDLAPSAKVKAAFDHDAAERECAVDGAPIEFCSSADPSIEELYFAGHVRVGEAQPLVHLNG